MLQTFLSSVPYFDNARSEGHFQSMIYVILTLLGINADVEVRSHQRRIDMVVMSMERIYIFEFKVDKDAHSALQQISLKDYPARFRAQPLPIVRVGVNFDSEAGTIDDWKVEEE